MKIICIGRNYAKHALELGNEIPEEPVIFIKPDSAVLRENRPFYIPSFTQDVHYELELIVRIDKVGKAIPVEFAPNYYSHIGLGIDFTARDLQATLKAKGLPWEKAKGFDYSAVISKFIAINDLNINGLNFELFKNDELVQQGNTSQMLYNVNEIISHVSHYFMLKKGDIIFTGTPEGVGPVAANDRLRANLQGQEFLNFSIF